MKTGKQVPEPMFTMLRRYEEIENPKNGYPKIYRKPEVTLGQLDKTARAVAEWDLSDPFAFGRTYLHTRQGYIEPKQTQDDYTARAVARRVAKRREVEEMQRRLRDAAHT